MFFGYNKNNDIWVQSSITSGDVLSNNMDKVKKSGRTTGLWWRAGGTFSGDGSILYTSRPTNTSVLYCIKY